jgi:uncharacterized protein (TIGR04255 family)
MVAKGTPLPRRIEPDAIIEALFEVRFDAESTLVEVLVARLSEIPEWKGFAQRRLPAYEMPPAFRDSDPNLRFIPVFELAGAEPKRAVRVGAHVLSYHCPAPYLGWDVFRDELNVAVGGLFDKTEGLKINRIGMRYINAFTPALHGLNNISDLALRIDVSGDQLRSSVALTFATDVDADTRCQTVLATREYVQGTVPIDAIAVLDLDVFTNPSFKAETRDAVSQWMEIAHSAHREAFFYVLQADTIQRLRRD